MAFEQNPQLMQLLNSSYAAPEQQQQQYRNPLQRQAPQQRYGQQQGYANQNPMMYMQEQPNQKNWWQSAWEYLLGSNPQYGYSSDYTPYQRQGFQDIFNQGMSNLQNPYEGFNEIENSTRDYYKNQLAPSVANQFTSMGGGALSSPDFAKQLGEAGTGLASQLAQHKIGYGQQNRQFGLQQAQLGLTPQYQSFYQPATGGLIGGALNAIPQLAKTGVKYGLMGRQ